MTTDPTPTVTGTIKPTPDLFTARTCGDMPTDCCDYGVISLVRGAEVCRVWEEDDARLIASLLSVHARAAPVPVPTDETAKLVERLRQHSHWGMTAEAADALEALAAENAQKDRHISGLRDEIANLLDDRDRLAEELARKDAVLRTIAHTFTEDSHGGMKTMGASWYQAQARAALADPAPVADSQNKEDRDG